MSGICTSSLTISEQNFEVKAESRLLPDIELRVVLVRLHMLVFFHFI